MNIDFINLKDYTIIHKFKTLYHGWECDPYGYIGRHNESQEIHAILTTHGSPYKADLEDLYYLVESYEHAIADTNAAINSLFTLYFITH